MQIYRVTDNAFKEYGAIIEGLEVSQLLGRLDDSTESPDDHTIYVADDSALDSLPVFVDVRDRVYGGMPVQIGYCNGTNFKLNCLEYHRGSEVNVSSKDFILLLAKVSDVQGGKLDTSKVKAFLVPGGVVVQVYETTLHYAPCAENFRVVVALPYGTNTGRPVIQPVSFEDRLLWARNKWLLAHKDAPEAKDGAYVGLVGANLDIQRD
ncbi:MAG: DUF4867 family protein [Sphaerochaetaceae bacterium]|nr:DUF4867 family protein [Spirochaetales bacterium]MDY5499838.1 DUF4867 family protein [Sphaerochaetaceae bacterium]